jgi:hypothetical protein
MFERKRIAWSLCLIHLPPHNCIGLTMTMTAGSSPPSNNATTTMTMTMASFMYDAILENGGMPKAPAGDTEHQNIRSVSNRLDYDAKKAFEFYLQVMGPTSAADNIHGGECARLCMCVCIMMWRGVRTRSGVSSDFTLSCFLILPSLIRPTKRTNNDTCHHIDVLFTQVDGAASTPTPAFRSF